MSERKKVLIVEDDKAILDMYVERFKKENLEVVIANDGEEALEKALRELPNVILLDLLLPKKGGLSVLEVLKSQPETRDIPVVIATAYPRDEYREKSTRNGATMFLSKSESMPGEVVEKVKEVMR